MLDLEKAKSSFKRAAKYAAVEAEPLKKESLARAGWCSFCQGDLQEAEALLAEACSVADVYPEAEFLLSKVLLCLNRPSDAAAPFKTALRSQIRYLLRAKNDQDFPPDILAEWCDDSAKEFRTEAVQLIESRYKPMVLATILDCDAVAALDRHNTFHLRFTLQAYERVKQTNLRTILDFLNNSNLAESMLCEELKRLFQSIDETIDKQRLNLRESAQLQSEPKRRDGIAKTLYSSFGFGGKKPSIDSENGSHLSNDVLSEMESQIHAQEKDLDTFRLEFRHIIE